MNIAKPVTGFKIKEAADIRAELQKHAGKWPRVHSYWDAIKDRLKMTAHKEGVEIGDPGNRVFEAAGESVSGLPTIRVAYHVLGDTLSFLQILIIDPDQAL